MIVHVGSILIISPPNYHYPGQFPNNILIILINPNSAFGDGTHPTTQMCLEALEQEIKGGEVILDLGTGSGILAIAAAKLGAKKVIAADSDSCSCQAALVNINLNRVEKVVKVFQGSIQGLNPNNKFDLIVANLYSAEEIIAVLPKLAQQVRVQGKIICSGILEEGLADPINCLVVGRIGQAEEIIRILADENFTVHNQTKKGMWIAITAIKGT